MSHLSIKRCHQPVEMMLNILKLIHKSITISLQIRDLKVIIRQGGVADISVKYMMKFLIDGGYRKTEQILELRDSIVSKGITEPMKMIILMKQKMVTTDKNR